MVVGPLIVRIEEELITYPLPIDGINTWTMVQRVDTLTKNGRNDVMDLNMTQGGRPSKAQRRTLDPTQIRDIDGDLIRINLVCEMEIV